MERAEAIVSGFSDLAEQASDVASYRLACKHLVDGLGRHLLSVGWVGGRLTSLPEGFLGAPAAKVRDPVVAAHLHAFAEHSATAAGIDAPAWTEDPASFLAEPVFAGGPRVRPFLLATTPAAFRRRFLFCSDPLAGLRPGTRP